VAIGVRQQIGERALDQRRVGQHQWDVLGNSTTIRSGSGAAAAAIGSSIASAAARPRARHLQPPGVEQVADEVIETIALGVDRRVDFGQLGLGAIRHRVGAGPTRRP
jgi:hypothetical protein